MEKGNKKKDVDVSLGKSRGNRRTYKLPVTKPELIGESLASTSPYSRTRGASFSSSIDLRYPILSSADLPYQFNDGCFVISDAITLCQKAYTKVPIYKNSIDMMSELANSKIYLTGGNKESRDFINAWFKRINLWKIKDQFFRECFRSGNVFFYRVDNKTDQYEAKKMKLTYADIKNIKLPIKYILMNPANIGLMGDINFENPIYFRVLNKFELNLLKNSSNSEDRETYKSIPDAIKKYFDGNNFKNIQPLNLNQLHAIFYKKQDYEPFAVPMGYSVMDSIELKLAMQKADSCIAKTVEYIILLVTMGAKKEDGGINPENFRLLKEAFKNEKLGRVLVSDYTTKAEFVIPDLNKVMGPEKYEVVNTDIANGLMNIFFGENKYANMMGKLKVFVEKLNDAQEIFINDFLAPEIKRVCKLMGFKNYPIPNFVKISLDDQTNLMRVYTQLIQMGVLTPKDGIEAIKNGELPEFDFVKENQSEYREDRDKGFFEPTLGGPYSQKELAELNAKNTIKIQREAAKNGIKKNQNGDIDKSLKINQEKKSPSGESGRPSGTKSPQTTKKINPIGASIEASFDSNKLIELSSLYPKVKEKLDDFFNEMGIGVDIDKESLANLIIENERPEDWINKIPEYIESPKAPNFDVIAEIQEIAMEYGVSDEIARLLIHCKY